jgi:hypothetical protein
MLGHRRHVLEVAPCVLPDGRPGVSLTIDEHPAIQLDLFQAGQLRGWLRSSVLKAASIIIEQQAS